MSAFSLFSMVLTCKVVGLAVLVFSLGACATYQPEPLPTTVDLATDITTLKVDAESFPLPQLKQHSFNPSDGLDWIEIAMLAVANNPDLKSSRTRHGKATAQVYAAGLLPDPQLSVGQDHPTNGGPDRVDGFDVGLGYDVRSLITRSAGHDAATAALQQVDLQLLWQEWQVIQQARLLTMQVLSTDHRLSMLNRAQARTEAQYRQAQRLLERGDLSLDVAAAVTTAWFDLSSRLNQARQLANRQRHELNALLGLMPEVKLSLTPIEPSAYRMSALNEQLWLTLPRRRPDLRALQAGYQSQEQRVRKSILAQFPALNIGFTRARDTDGIYTSGFGITLKLPFFSGNRGRIAIERASRAQLRAEYQARLDRTRSDISRLLNQQRILHLQQANLQQHLPELESLVKAARRAYRQGDLTALDLLNLETTWLDKHLELINLEQALWQARVALDTLLAWPESED